MTAVGTFFLFFGLTCLFAIIALCSKYKGIAVLLMLTICLEVFLFLFVFTMPHFENRIARVSPAGKVIDVGNEIACSCKGYCLEYRDFSQKDIPLVVRSNVSVSTENPEIRKIEIALFLQVVDFSTALQLWLDDKQVDLSDKVPTSKEISKGLASLVEYDLYEFRNKNTVALSQLYNPHDHEQNVLMQKIITEAMAEDLLQKGFRIGKVEWKVN